MRLSDFIVRNMEPLLQDWEDFARSLGPVTGIMNVTQLRDHAEAMLRVIAADLDRSQTDKESIDKSWGLGPGQGTDTAAETHAEDRLRSGFTIEQLISEYRALRASVLRLWSTEAEHGAHYQVRDITRFNEAIDQALAESVTRYADMARQSQDVFVGIVGHDLRTPLQSVSLGAEYLANAPDSSARQAELGARMLRSCRRMGEMLDTILDFTEIRLEGGIPICPVDADLGEVSAQVVDELRRSRPTATIRSEVRGDVTGVWDPARMGQIYQNLIGNAVQHGCPGGEVSVVTAGNADQVELVVHNTGKPIPADEQERIFDLLHRTGEHADGEDARSGRNLGLGLYITREIVLAHRGSISVRSIPEEGTTFTVRLPRDAKAF